MNDNCVILGAGNLATNLALALKQSGFAISQVYSRTEKNAKALSKLTGADYTSLISDVKTNASIYFIVVKDDAIEEVLNGLDLKGKLLIHCSGSTPMEILSNYSGQIGVLYPLQTFSKERLLDFREIPLFIEANSEKNLITIQGIANKLSGKVTITNSEKRQVLHIAAVFACNFVNHLYVLSGDVLEKQGLSFDLLKPLIEETVRKIEHLHPKQAQTGPAVRFDKKIISKHIEALNDEPRLKDMYQFISESIYKYYQQ